MTQPLQMLTNPTRYLFFTGNGGWPCGNRVSARQIQVPIKVFVLIDGFYFNGNADDVISHTLFECPMITAAQLRAAHALLDIDQKAMAAMAGVSVPTIQRMEASTGNVRG